MNKCIYCSFCSTCFSLTSKDCVVANEAYAVLFCLFLLTTNLPSIQYSLLLHKGFGIIQFVCCMVSSLSFQLVGDGRKKR